MTLPIKRKWWDMIRFGEKKEEYREINEFYAKRFATVLGLRRPLNPERLKDVEVPFQGIRLRAGYRLESPTMQVDGRLRVGTGKPEWGATPGVEYFILTIDNIELLCTDDWKPTLKGRKTLDRREKMDKQISKNKAIEVIAALMPKSITPDGSHPADEEIFRIQEIYADCIEAIEILPTQPGIVRCKDCKHNPKYAWFDCPMSHLSEKQRPETAWCWKGERREDG